MQTLHTLSSTKPDGATAEAAPDESLADISSPRLPPQPAQNNAVSNYKQAASFAAAVEQELLYDVSAAAKRYGLKLPTRLTKELWQDITSRLPGEMGSFKAEERLEIVVAQAVSILVRSTEPINFTELHSFAATVRRREDCVWNMELPLLAEPIGENVRSDPAPQRLSTGFAPYTLQASLEHDAQAKYSLILALQHPFSPITKPL